MDTLTAGVRRGERVSRVDFFERYARRALSRPTGWSEPNFAHLYDYGASLIGRRNAETIVDRILAERALS